MNPLPISGQMTFKDAALVAFFLALGVVVTTFLPTHSFETIQADPWRSLFELVVTIFGTWVVQFLILTGLNVYAQRSQQTAATT